MASTTDMTVGVMFPSEWLAAIDLGGGSFTLTVESVTAEMVTLDTGRKEKHWVVAFERAKKRLLLNKTNAYALGVLLSPDAHDWAGKRVTLVGDWDKMKGQDVMGIRVCGSPDARPDRARVFAECWEGERAKGALCARLKQALNRLAKTRPATQPPATQPSTPPSAPKPAPEDNEHGTDTD